MKQVQLTLAIVCLGLFLVACSRDPESSSRRYLASGEQYMKDGKYREANIRFRSALQANPRSSDAYYRLAQSDLELHQWTDAYASLQRVLELDPSRPDAHIDLAQLYLATGQYDKVEEETKIVLDHDPANQAAHLVLGLSYVARRKFDRALSAFSKVISLAPNSAPAYMNLGLVEMAIGDYAGAESNLKKSTQLDSRFAIGYINLANFYRLRSEPAVAEQTFRDGIERDPDDTDLYVHLAELLSAQGKTADTVGLLNQLRARKPKAVDVALLIGDYYAQRKELDAALAEYRRGLTIDSENTDLNNHVVDAYLSNRKVAEASTLNQKTLKSKPKDITARIQQARIWMMNGDEDRAISELRALLADASDSAEAHYFLGLAYQENSQPAQAQTEFQEALKSNPNMLMAVRALAQLHSAMGNNEVAQEYAEKNIQLQTTDETAHLLLGQILLRMSKVAQAKEQFAIAELLMPSDPNPHVSLASCYVKENNFTSADKEFEAAQTLAPQSSAILGSYLDYLVSRKQQEKAIQRVKTFVANNPQDANAHLLLGSLSLRQKDYSKARTEIQRSIELNPNSANAYLYLGKTYQDEGNTEPAIESYEKALQLQPKFAPLQTMLGNLYAAKGDLAQARGEYEAALSADPNFGLAASSLASLTVRQGGNLDVALGLAQKAKQLLPDVDSVTDTLAWIEYLKGSYSSALPLLKECVTQAPKYPVYRYHLGMAALANGDKREAKSELETALRLNLTGEDAASAHRALTQID
jgi:tetratricopeptide (TPR) repeat protein